MTAHKYDGVHHQVVTMNMKDGSVQGHKAGCADLKRGVRKFAEPSQRDDILDVTCLHDAWIDYNADFLAECDEHEEECNEAQEVCNHAYTIEWAACVKGIPATLEEAEKATETKAPAKAKKATSAKNKGIEVRSTGKYTRVYIDGKEVGYLPTILCSAAALEALIK